ncbi:MAG: Glutamyl-tRNA(Gln) synthetase (EC [uncultured Sulfurovum sp.]|uniref:Glutamyl-tRNA(Gln) synthetase (EC) n=1 Tax=uncultured Sulfurovum sp. TaxID=269237 RepID=A0A6S6U8E1_9BACT|nr:MAG: Glutamyl-tRNA(Gln) synthetase (EC [uncultured Sulfurovum sp.]
MLRFASSPTDDMHISNLRVAIVSYLMSQQKEENFTVRIDDTHKKENIEGKDTEIMQILEKFALTHTSVFHQSEHLHMHQTFAIKLLEENSAFLCTCTLHDETGSYTEQSYLGHCQDIDPSEQKELHKSLKASGKPFVIRLKSPTHNIVYHDLIQGDVMTPIDKVDSFVILHEDGTPSHTFASACDDMLSGVTTVIDTAEHLRDTAKEVHIKKQLGYEQETNYVHLSSLLNVDGKALSKEDDLFYVKSLLEEGFIPDAIINYLLLLGYTSGNQEIFTLPEAIEWFNLDNLSKTATTFDIEKLRFINKEHLKKMDDKRLSSLFGFADESIGKLAKLYLEEVSTTKELEAKVKPIFQAKDFSRQYGKEMRKLEHIIADAPYIESYDAFHAYLTKKSGFSDKILLKPLRCLLTGNYSNTENEPKLSDIYPFIKSYILEVAS